MWEMILGAGIMLVGIIFGYAMAMGATRKDRD